MLDNVFSNISSPNKKEHGICALQSALYWLNVPEDCVLLLYHRDSLNTVLFVKSKHCDIVTEHCCFVSFCVI